MLLKEHLPNISRTQSLRKGGKLHDVCGTILSVDRQQSTKGDGPKW
jgi:hypothetical protein